MSKWIARLKDIKNTVPDERYTFSQANKPIEHSPVKDNTKAIYPTLPDICVSDGIEVSDNLPDTSIRENTRNTVPDGLNLPYTEVSGKHPTLPDTSPLGPTHQGVTISPRPNTIPRLPPPLERLVSAASSDLLSGFTFDGVGDINNYVRAWACAYLAGDQQHALDRLHQVQVARELSR